MTPEEALDFIVTRYGNDPGVEEALAVLLAGKAPAPSVSVDAETVSFLKLVIKNGGYSGASLNQERAIRTFVQRAEARKAQPDYDAIIGTFISTKDLFAAKAPEKPSPVAEKVKKHDGPCWRNSHADCGC